MARVALNEIICDVNVLNPMQSYEYSFGCEGLLCKYKIAVKCFCKTLSAREVILYNRLQENHCELQTHHLEPQIPIVL